MQVNVPPSSSCGPEQSHNPLMLVAGSDGNPSFYIWQSLKPLKVSQVIAVDFRHPGARRTTNVKELASAQDGGELNVVLCDSASFSSSLLDLDPLSSSGPSAPSAAPTSWGGKSPSFLSNQLLVHLKECKSTS